MYYIYYIYIILWEEDDAKDIYMSLLSATFQDITMKRCKRVNSINLFPQEFNNCKSLRKNSI